MIKKTYIIILLCILVISCGKKGDPFYKEQKQNTKVFSKKLNTIS